MGGLVNRKLPKLLKLHLENVILFETPKMKNQNLFFVIRYFLCTNRDSCDFKKLSLNFLMERGKQDSESVKWAGKFIQLSEQSGKESNMIMESRGSKSSWWCCRNVNNSFYLLIAHFHMSWQENGGNQNVTRQLCLSAAALLLLFFLIHEKLIFLVTREWTQDDSLGRKFVEKIPSYASTHFSIVKC